MQIRLASLEDIIVIEQIEESAPSSWSKPLIFSELHQPNSIQLVAIGESESNIIGWCCARLLVPEAEILKITVMLHFRRSGAGTLLLHHLTNRCDIAGCNKIFLEVRERNQAARNFYKKTGFEEKGIRKRYYSDPTDSAIILQKTWNPNITITP